MRRSSTAWGATTYWVRGGELLNVWIARYEPDFAAFEQEEGDWFPVSQEEILREVGEAFTGSASRDDLLALAGAIVRRIARRRLRPLRAGR